jgi:indolepyruvate ferredoxin oxidoreductase alpha subunit
VPCGGFEPLYQALSELLPEGHPVAGDVGCSILHGYFPPQLITTAYALGTSIGTAAGMSLSGRKGVAVIGDTGFLHSGITGLLNAVEFGHDVLVIVLYNRISAMTPGAQEIKGMERLKSLIEACGPTAVDEIDLDRASPDELRGLLKKRLEERGVHVVIARAEPRPFS